ncbi:hypothetical protein E4U43_003007 [Claviceps pusilla]|uniref:Pentatricopeptide repeat protein n=1 Tax=Claviceps pusilla TaxID=123648 RepID=A0A9P7N7U5_9HYPO|nr:hypothetical protein E4U43_003007 [Claviceps pusilla]
MQVVCLGRARCARLSLARGTSTSLGSAAKSSQQSLFSTCPRRLLPETRSRFSSPSTGVQSEEDSHFMAHFVGVRRAPDHPSQQQGPRPRRAIAPSTECTETQPSSSNDRDERSSNSRGPRFSIEPASLRRSREPAPLKSSRSRGRPKSKFSPEYTRRRSLSGLDTWTQWGYLRHQCSGEELLNFRREFNRWKKRLSKIRDQTYPDRPWERDAEWLLEHDTVSAMRSAWHELDEKTRREKWPCLVLSAMRISPQRVHTVLEATVYPPPPGYAIHDVLIFIAQNARLNEASTPREKTLEAEEMMELLRNIMTDIPKGHIPFTQRVFGLFAKALPSEQAHQLYLLLREHELDLHANTLIQFASKLAGSAAHKEAAFEILRGLSEAGADLNEARPSSVITALLHCKAPEERGVDVQPSFDAREALQYFIQRGFTMNVLATTAFLDTLCQSGEVEEAIRLASLFTESGIQLDKKAWTTIFRGAKGSLRMDYIAKALELAKAANVPIVDVLNNALHSAFVFSEAERREKPHSYMPGTDVFTPLLRVYAKKFDLEPLQWWLPDALPFFLAQGGVSQQQQEEEEKEQQKEHEHEHEQQQLQQYHQQQHQHHQGLLVLQGNDATKRRWNFESTIIPFIDQLFSAAEDTKLRPSLTTIAIMLRAYIRSLRAPYDITTYYAFFKTRLEEQSRNPSLPSASRLITNQASLIHDTFILAMTDYPDLSRSALEVFGDMLKDQMHTANSNHNDHSSTTTTTTSNHPPSRISYADSPSVVATSPIHPAPTVMTFTILLRGLMNPSNRLLAEHLRQVMQENGIAPNLVTWNTVISGYAHMQNIRRTVDTLQDMEATGLKPDIYTFKAFGRLKDQAKALKLMEGIIDANGEKMAGGVYE